MKKILTVLLLSFLSVTAQASEQADKTAAAKEVLEASNAKAIFSEARDRLKA